MSAILRKELRLLCMPWLVALALTLAPALLGSPFRSLQGFAFAAAIILLSVAPVGREITCNTFSALLALPIDRRRIWAWKTGLLFSSAASLCAAWLLSERRSQEEAALMMSGTLAALTTGLWTTILLRQVAASVCFTLLIPALLIIVTHAIAERLQAHQSLIPFTLGVYAIISFVLARKLFVRAEDVPWAGAYFVELPVWNWKSGTTSRCLPARKSPWSVLVRKELQLQAPTFVVAGCVAVLHLGVTGLRVLGVLQPTPTNSSTIILIEVLPFFWLFIPLLAGATVIAEERRMGTIEAQLSLPLSTRRQFLLKAGITGVISLIFGAIMPVAIASLANTGHPAVHSATEEFWLFCGSSLIISIVALLASSLSRGLSEALPAAVAIGVVLVLAFALTWYPPYVNSFSPLWPPFVVERCWPFVTFTAALLLAARFCRRAQVTMRDWLTTATVMVVSWTVVIGVSSFIYFRVWELVLPLEGRHHAPIFDAAAPPKLIASHPWIAVVLPDGRLWVRRQREQELPSFFPKSMREHLSLRAQDAAFMPGADWKDAAATVHECVAIRTNGTLWEVRHSAVDHAFTVHAVGTSSNWTSVRADSSHFLALRSDKTLWTWGRNESGELGIDLRPERDAKPGARRNEPVSTPTQIGNDSDWLAAVAIGAGSLAFRTNGTAWCWGKGATNLSIAAGAPYLPQACRLATVPRAVSGNSGLRAFVQHDESLWIGGLHSTARLLDGAGSGQFTNSPLVPLDTTRRWKDVVVTTHPSQVTALASDGVLWRWNRISPQPYTSHQLGKYSDWLAVECFEESALSLAADGSLWLWHDNDYRGGYKLIGPSRRPVKIATVN